MIRTHDEMPTARFMAGAAELRTVVRMAPSAWQILPHLGGVGAPASSAYMRNGERSLPSSAEIGITSSRVGGSGFLGRVFGDISACVSNLRSSTRISGRKVE